MSEITEEIRYTPEHRNSGRCSRAGALASTRSLEPTHESKVTSARKNMRRMRCMFDVCLMCVCVCLRACV